MRNAHCRTWILARKLKKLKNENHPLYVLEYGKKKKERKKKKWKKRKTWKNKNAHYRTWNVDRKLKKHGKKEMDTVKPVLWCETLKNVQNETCTL